MKASRIILFCLMMSASYLFGGIMDLENWYPVNGGNVGALPEMTMIDSPYGPAVQVKVLEENRYQGVSFRLSQPIDTAEIGTITFRIKQTAVKRLPIHGCLHLYYTEKRNNGLFITFLVTPPEPGSDWSLVTIPIDLNTAGTLGHQPTPQFGKALGGCFSLFAALKMPGQTMAIADLKFNKKVEGFIQIPVIHYEYKTKRTSGDSSGKILTDGKVEEADQPFYAQYTDAPEIVFDLGAFYLVKKIDVSAVAIPGQNFYEYQVLTSKDGKTWKPGASISSKDDSGLKKAYTVSGDNLSLLGRYFKLKLGRSRTDFHIRLAEVAFTGKIPTQEEIDAVAAKNYDIGPKLSGDYLTLETKEASLCVDKHTGVAFNYIRNGEKVAERIFGSYELSDGLTSTGADDYSAKVISSETTPEGISVRYTLPDIEDIVFTRTYTLTDGLLNCRLAFESTRKDKKILFTATDVVLTQDIRNDGLYETWGAGHDMQHKFAFEVAYRYPADTGPVVVFESPKKKRTLLHFRFKHNERYIQIGSGTVTVAGVGDKRTAFLPTGWELGDGLFQLTEPGTKGSVESRLIVCNGDLPIAFNRYLALPEVKSFRSRIKRPAWLKDVRFLTNQGWIGLWGDSAARSAEYYSSFIREGDFIYGMGDSDMVWGDFPTEGSVFNIFGGELTYEQLLQRQRDVRKASNNHARLSQYTWLWSVSNYSQVYKKQPEWFINKNAKGEEISFFPTWGTNYYRQLKEPGSWQHTVDAITNFVNTLELDMWYLDGGGSPVSINWPRMIVDEPDAYDTAYLQIRENIQRKNPDAGIFFNHPENPIGDIGYLENSGGILTSNWRDGATWMYKFKLWQRPDPLFTPVYIYWNPVVDTAIRQYMVGTGLAFATGRTSGDQRRNIPYISALQQSRWARLVSANIMPNWRYEPDEMLETMPLSFGDDGWIFMKNHDKTPITRKVAFDATAIGLPDNSAPIYHWEYLLKDYKDVVDLQNESDREKGYAASGWQSGFVITPTFLQKTNYAVRLERSFQIAPDKMKLWYVTQSPALVWSVDNLRNQMPLSKTMGVAIKGRETADGIALSVDSERKTAELAALIPAGKAVASVNVNGQATSFDTVVWGGTPMAIVPVLRGKSQVQITFSNAITVPGAYKIAATPGETLTINIEGPHAPVVASILFGKDLIWSKAIMLSENKKTEEITVPSSVMGGIYSLALYDMCGKILAEGQFKQAAGKPGTGTYDVIVDHPLTTSKKPLSLTVNGLAFSAQAEHHHPKAGNLILEPENGALEIHMNNTLPSQFNDMAGAFEIKAKRYLRVRLTGNYAKMGKLGPFTGPRNFTQRYGDAESMAALEFDFEGATGYSVRSFAGLGVLNLPINTNSPMEWGAANKPDHLFTISAIVSGISGKDEEELWLDLAALGAPDDWTGRLWFGLRFTHANPNRFMRMEILETADTLPEGSKAVDAFTLKGGTKPPTEPQVFTLPKISGIITIDGKMEEDEWKNALVFSGFSLLGNPALKPPSTQAKMMRDAQNINVCIVFEDNRPFRGDKGTICWFNDGVEMYFQKRTGEKAMIQFIIDAADNWFAQDYSNYDQKGTPVTKLEKPNFASTKNNNVWTLELSFPIALLGEGNSVTGFNFGRNRIFNSTTQNFSLAPGSAYRNFKAFSIKWDSAVK